MESYTDISIRTPWVWLLWYSHHGKLLATKNDTYTHPPLQRLELSSDQLDVGPWLGSLMYKQIELQRLA